MTRPRAFKTMQAINTFPRRPVNTAQDFFILAVARFGSVAEQMKFSC